MNNDLIHVNTLPPFKRMCMTIGELPTSYLESMTYYEMLVWLCNYIEKTVIPTINNNGEAVEELQQKYVELKAYVDNYFDNLDVQEEINNKLDDMAESGELTDIIAQYLGLAGVLAFNTVAELKAAENLVNGSITKTLGFYSMNDKGGSFYKIRNITNNDVIDEVTIISLQNSETLIAELILEKTMSVKQFGVYGDNIHDDSDKLQIALDQSIPLLLDTGTYIISKKISLSNNILIGNDSTIKAVDFVGTTMLLINNDVTLKNIIFNCNTQAESVIDETSNGNNLIIENCIFKNSKAHTENNFSLTSCVYLTAKNCKINNSSFSNNNSHGCRLYAKESNTIIDIDNCKFNSNGNSNVEALGLVQYGTDNGLLYNKVTIANSVALNNSKSGIAPHSANNVTISNCISNNNGEHGFVLMDGKNGIITNCIALNNSYYGARIQGDYNNTNNPGYENFIISNNYFKGGGVFVDFHAKHGIISNNLIVRDTISETPKGIKLGTGTDNSNRIPLKELTVINNTFKGYDDNNEILSFVNIDDTNKFDDNKFENLPSPKSIGFSNTNNAYSLFSGNKGDFIIGNTNNVIEDTIFNTGWSAAGGGTISGNTLTPSSSGNLMWKTINYSGEKYICVYFNVSNYPTSASYGVNLRTRNSGGTLIGEKSFTYQRLIGNKLIVLFDLANTQFDFTNVAKLDIMFAGNSNAQITINSCYVTYSNDLPHLLNIRD